MNFTANRSLGIAILIFFALLATLVDKYDFLIRDRTVHATSSPGGSIDSNSLLTLELNNSLIGSNGESPVQSSNISYASGLQGNAIVLSTGSLVTYSSAQNIYDKEGTLELWIKPNWRGNDNLGHAILSYSNGGGMIVLKDSANNLRLIVNRYGDSPGGEQGVGFNISSWMPGQWHYVAFSWSDSTKRLRLYIDGVLKAEQRISLQLPTLSASTFQLGADGQSNYLDSAVDSLRISSIERSANEIIDRMNSAITITGWDLNPNNTNLTLLSGWVHRDKISVNATTNIGSMTLPFSAANWSSSNSGVAVVDSNGWIKAMSAGTATLTGGLGGISRFLNVTVTAPVLPPVDEPVDPYLATPAQGALFRIPVVIVRFQPTTDGVNLDRTETDWISTLAEVKARSNLIEKRHKFMLEEGSRYQGYKLPNNRPSLGYEVIKSITIYEKVPRGFPGSATTYFPDYHQILNRINAEHLVNVLGVKEFWLVYYHHGSIVPDESNMSSPLTGDVSNSWRWSADQPVFQKTYVTYGINITRTENEATHNHGHQLESIFAYLNSRQDGNTNLFWNLFARPIRASFPYGRAGNTHFPPNAIADYDYDNPNPAPSDIMDWNPDGGPLTMVNNATWRNLPYPWPAALKPSFFTETHWYMMWMQTMPGIGSNIIFSGNQKKLTNWWQFTGDWDAAIKRGIGLHENPACTYQLSNTSITVGLSGGSGAINVTAPAGCKWIASSNYPDWITVTDGGEGSGTVSYTVQAQSGTRRTGSIVIANQLVSVVAGTQMVAPSNLTATAVSTTQINLRWIDNAPDEVGYQVSRRLSSATDTAANWIVLANLAANVTSYSSTGLTAATGYTYRVCAIAPGGAFACAADLPTTTMAATVAPTGLTVTPVSTTQINLRWTDASTNETGYRVSRRLTSGTTWTTLANLAANVTSYSSTGLTAATGYTYRVCAVAPGGTLVCAADRAATTLATTAPTGVTATSISATQINLRWTDAATNETGYRILRRLTSSTTWTTLATLVANMTSYNNTGLTAATGYTYRICAVVANGISVCAADVAAVTFAVTLAPSGVTATPVSTTQINLRWTDAATNETGYRVSRRLTSGTTWTTLANLAANVTSYSSTGLTIATGYTYRVCAIAPGSALVCAADRAATTLATMAPTGVTATPVSATQINLRWTDAATNEMGYRISRRLTSGTTWTTLPTLAANVTSYSNTGLNVATSYTYRVCAVAPNGTIACAADVGATTMSSGLTTFNFTRASVSANGAITRFPGSAQQYVEDLGSGVKLEMVVLPQGSFTMGSPASEASRYSSEGPQRVVNLNRFAMGKYEVTQAQWRAVMGTNPSSFTGDNLPVERVSWNDAQEFCRRLNVRLGLSGSSAYRLPSEAEWEYAARAGTKTPFAFGQTINAEIVNYNGSFPYGSAPPGVYRQRTVNVGSLGVANGWGLYDMYGNVWEWVEDDWHDSYIGAPTDGRAWVDSPRTAEPVIRGGSWHTRADGSRSAYRQGSAPGSRNTNLGFRLARN